MKKLTRDRFRRLVHGEDLATDAPHELAAWLPGPVARRLQPLAGVPQGVLPRRPIALVAPLLEVGLGPGRQEHPPCLLKAGAGLVQARCGATAAFARVGSRIETAAPFPGIGVVGISGAPRKRADMHVAVIDVPAVVALGISSPGELRHQKLNRALASQANCQRVGGWRLRKAPAIVCLMP
jgi:hypothetical protein